MAAVAVVRGARGVASLAMENATLDMIQASEAVVAMVVMVG